MKELFWKEGILHNFSLPYTPQHNGLAKKENKTIIKMNRCLLIGSNLAIEWWGEVEMTAMKMKNFLPSL